MGLPACWRTEDSRQIAPQSAMANADVADAEKKGLPESSPWLKLALLGLLAVSSLAVRADVQSFALFLFGHAQADHQIDDLEGHCRHHR